MKKERYVYPAFVNYNADEKVYYIKYPDLDNAFTFSENEEEIYSDAKEVLELCLYDLEELGKEPPEASKITDINSDGGTIILVDVWMPVVRDKFENKSIKKTLTIPKWMNDLAEKSNVNFSQLLQVAIKEYLGIEDNIAIKRS